MADTAELPRVSPPALASVVPDTVTEIPEWLEVGAPAVPGVDVPDGTSTATLSSPSSVGTCDLPVPPRSMLRMERRRERRQRMWWATAGIAVMAAMLGVTVAVLSMVR